MAETTENLTIRTILNLVSRRWPLVVIALAVFAIGAIVVAHYLPLAYTGSTIFERRQDIAADASTMRGSESFEGQKLTLKHELAGMVAVTKAVEQLGLTRGFQRDSNGQLTMEGQRAKQKLVEQIMARIKIKWETSSPQVDLVSVSFEDSNPWLAENMPNTLVSNYINQVSEQSVERLSASRTFLENQVTLCDNRYTELMKQRIDFEVKNAGLLPDSPAMLYEGLTRLNADLDALRLQNEVAKQTLVGLTEMTPGDLDPSGDPNGTGKPMEVHYGTNPEYIRLNQELVNAKNALAAALVNKLETHPDVIMWRDQIQRIEEQLHKTEPQAVLETVFGSNKDNTLAIQMLTTKASAEMTEKEMARVESRLESHKNLLNNFGPIRREYLDIVKKLEEQQAELSQWEDRLRDVHMALAAEVAKRRTHLNAVQPALEQFYPSSPEFKKVLGFALAGGLAFGIGLLILIHRLDRSVMTPEQATRVLGIPVYGYVDVILTPAQMTWRWVKRWILLPVIFLVLALAFAVSCYSLSLRLNAPDEYGQWRARPVQYLSEQIKNRLHSSEETGGY